MTDRALEIMIRVEKAYSLALWELHGTYKETTELHKLLNECKKRIRCTIIELRMQRGEVHG